MSRLPDDLERVVLAMWEDLDCSMSLKMKILYEHGEWVQLVSARAEPQHYLDGRDYFHAVCASDFLRKCSGLPLSDVDPEATAFKTWSECELRNFKSNLRLERHLCKPSGPLADIPVHDFLMRVRKRVSEILGPIPDDLTPKHGPGATYLDTSATGCTVVDKMTNQPTATSDFLVHLLPLWEETAWCRGLVESRPYFSRPVMVNEDRYVSVIKTALTNRPISIGPSLNVAYQLSVGREIRKRLLRHGLVLGRARSPFERCTLATILRSEFDGQRYHRLAAQKSSVDDESATVDMTSASDLWCRNAVKLLCPSNWYELMDVLRTRQTVLPDGRTIHLEKFSAMGNGFTFELETLLFLCVAEECLSTLGIPFVSGYDLLVYGDDIIIDKGAVDLLLSVLTYLGHIPNQRKTYRTGYFRESCGGDFFFGDNVRPFYLGEIPDEPAKWISLANGLNRLAANYSSNGWGRCPFRRSWFRALDAIPSDVRRCRGPSILGDIVIHDTPERWSTTTRNHIRYLRVWRPIVDKKPISLTKKLPGHFPPPVDGVGPYRRRTILLGCWPEGPTMAAALYGLSSDGVTPRGAVSGYRFGRVPYS